MTARPVLRDDLAELPGYHSPQVDVAVRLNTNESPVPPPPGFADALAAEMSRVPWNRYPDRHATALRTAIAEHHGVDQAMVLAANGSNEVIQALCLAYGGSGRTVAVFEPTYRLHSHIATLTGAEVLAGRRASDYSLDFDEVERLVASGSPRPAITFLCSPNNPTGMADDPALTKAVADMVAPGLLVVDEAYGQFADWSALGLIEDDRPLVVTRTFSKTWSMAAARLGYMVGPPWLVGELERVLLPYHLDTAKQLAGRVALRFVDEMKTRVTGIVVERERLVAALARMSVQQWPSHANFVLFRPLGRDGREVWHALLDRSVLVRDCSSWPGLDGCLRVTVGTPEEDDAFIAALDEVLGS